MTVVIIGAGHAGVQAAESLRVEGYSGDIVLLDKDAHLPYQRPPLSKDYMAEGGDPSPVPLRGAAFYEAHGIDLRTGAEVVAIDTDDQLVRLADGGSVRYDELILATGSDARRAQCAGTDLSGISYLRTADDAQALRAELDRGHGSVVIVGAGFIGLEFAAVAAKRGLDVTVIDFAQRPMQRVLSPSMSDHFTRVHGSLGVKLNFDEGLSHFIGRDGHVAAVIGTSGTEYPCDFTVVGLGAVTDDALAASGGIVSDRGVVVDDHLRTNQPNVYAIGDLALFPSPHFGGNLRLESVQNATDMAKTVAKTIAGRAAPYHATPWFWSNQGPAKLQIVGLADPVDVVVERGDRDAGKFSQFLFRDEALVAVESVNSPADHVAARKLMDHGASVTMQQVKDRDFDFKAYAREISGSHAI